MRRDPIILLTIGTLLLIGLFYMPAMLTPEQMVEFSNFYSDLPLITLVAIACLVTSLNGPRRERVFWRLFASGFGCWLAAHCIYGFAPGVENSPELQLTAHGFYTCFYAQIILALGLAPDRRDESPARAVSRLFGFTGVVLLALQFLIYFGLIPYYLERDSLLSRVPTFFLFASFNAIFFVMAVRRMYHAARTPWRSVYVLMAIAASFWFVVDVLDDLHYMQAFELPAGTFLDAIWFTPHVTIILASRLRARNRGNDVPSPERRETESAFPALLLAAGFLGPLGHLGVSWIQPVDATTGFAREITILLGLLGFFTLAFLQHRFVSRHNRSLRHSVDELSLNEARLHEQRLQSLGLLAGGVAHDFNNLLMGVQGHAEMTAETLPADHPGRKHIDQILSGVRQASNLTGQMLAYAGRRPIRREVVDLNQVILESEALTSAIVGVQANIKVRLDSNPLPVEADESQLRQILINLINNSVDAMTDHPGTIRVETSRLHVEAGTTIEGSPDRPGKGDYALIEIQDNGAGMERETIRRSFDPFYTTKSSSRGLGLAAVHGIVRAHGGFVQVQSIPDQGSRFTIFLPSSTKPIPIRSAPPGGEQWIGHGIVLVVDDRNDVRSVAKSMLERAGFEVLGASGGKEGLELARRHGDSLQAVLLDLAMPGMEGDEVARELHAVHPRLPIVMMSGYDRARLDERTLDCVAGFLNKPFTSADLRVVMQQALKKASSRSKE